MRWSGSAIGLNSNPCRGDLNSVLALFGIIAVIRFNLNTCNLRNRSTPSRLDQRIDNTPYSRQHKREENHTDSRAQERYRFSVAISIIIPGPKLHTTTLSRPRPSPTVRSLSSTLRTVTDGSGRSRMRRATARARFAARVGRL